MESWYYYNHAALPATPPHVPADIAKIEDGTVWRLPGGRPLLARWVTDFDCGQETRWWYVIKDGPFDPAALKAKRRYEIRKGQRHFAVERIDPAAHAQALYEVQVAAYGAYPPKYRPRVDRQEFLADARQWEQFVCLGAFCRDTGLLCGYALLTPPKEGFVDFRVLRTRPQQEKNGVNAALVAGILEEFGPLLASGGYVCDGARSIRHETAFQDYLEKYFGFRKAYCRLHRAYAPGVALAVRLAYPWRKVLRRLDGLGLIHRISALLEMEEIYRKENV